MAGPAEPWPPSPQGRHIWGAERRSSQGTAPSPPWAPRELRSLTTVKAFCCPQPSAPWDETQQEGTEHSLGETPQLLLHVAPIGIPITWINSACPARLWVQPSRSRLRFGTVPSLLGKSYSQHSYFWGLLLLNTKFGCYKPPLELSSCLPHPFCGSCGKTDFLVLAPAGWQDRASWGHVSPLLCWGSSP